LKSLCNVKAAPMQSNPAPRFAVVAGTVTVTEELTDIYKNNVKLG
jgi:hypothetical protein